MLFATSALLLKYPRVISSGSADLWAPCLNGQSCILHTLKKCIPLPHQVCLLWAVVCSIPKCLVAVERETNNIRLKAGSNDVLAKINPNYLPSLIYLTAVLSNVPLNGH